MSKLVAYTQDGEKLCAKGNYNEMSDMFDRLSKETPGNIRTYQKLELYNDAKICIVVHSHPTKKYTLSMYNRIHDKLKENGLPLYGVDDHEIAELIHFTDKAFENLGNAFIAFRITERQGGCWVFE